MIPVRLLGLTIHRRTARMNLGTPQSHQRPRLTVEQLAKCKSDARREGIFAGLTSGLLAGVIGNRLMGFNRNKTLAAGILTTALSGYFFTQGFLSSRVAELEMHQALMGSSPRDTPTSVPESAFKSP